MNPASPSEPGAAPEAEPESRQEPVEVPYTELSPEALRGVVECYVLREGTDYGDRDITLDQKVAQVLSHLQRGEARVMFDPDTETVTIAEAVRPHRRF